MTFFSKKLGIDLGTANTLVFVPGKGIVLNEPSVVAISLEDNRILAVGNEAKVMIGKTPEAITAYRPMKDGVIADYKVTEAMLSYYMKKAMGGWQFIKPEVLISVPAGVTSTERRAVIEAAIKAGAENIKMKIGSALPIDEELSMIIKGRDLVSGLPKSVEIKTNEIVKAISRELREIVKAVKDVLQETPPELAADIIDQ